MTIKDYILTYIIPIMDDSGIFTVSNVNYSFFAHFDRTIRKNDIIYYINTRMVMNSDNSITLRNHENGGGSYLRLDLNMEDLNYTINRREFISNYHNIIRDTKIEKFLS